MLWQFSKISNLRQMLIVIQGIFFPIKTNSASALTDISEQMMFGNWRGDTQGHVLLLTFLLLLKPRSIAMRLSHRIRPCYSEKPPQGQNSSRQVFLLLFFIVRNVFRRAKSWIDKQSHICHSWWWSKQSTWSHALKNGDIDVQKHRLTWRETVQNLWRFTILSR